MYVVIQLKFIKLWTRNQNWIRFVLLDWIFSSYCIFIINNPPTFTSTISILLFNINRYVSHFKIAKLNWIFFYIFWILFWINSVNIAIIGLQKLDIHLHRLVCTNYFCIFVILYCSKYTYIYTYCNFFEICFIKKKINKWKTKHCVIFIFIPRNIL